MSKTRSPRRRRKAKTARQTPKQQLNSVLFDVIDELDAVMGLLRGVPELFDLVRLVRAVRESDDPKNKPDAIAECAQGIFGVNLDQEPDEDVESRAFVTDAIGTPEAVCEGVRWRLWRVRRLLDLLLHRT